MWFRRRVLKLDDCTKFHVQDYLLGMHRTLVTPESFTEHPAQGYKLVDVEVNVTDRVSS